MVPFYPGQQGAVRMPARLHIKFRPSDQLLGPPASSSIHNGQGIPLFVGVDKDHPALVRRHSWGRSKAKTRRNRCSWASGQRLAIHAATGFHEIHVPTGDLKSPPPYPTRALTESSGVKSRGASLPGGRQTSTPRSERPSNHTSVSPSLSHATSERRSPSARLWGLWGWARGHTASSVCPVPCLPPVTDCSALPRLSVLCKLLWVNPSRDCVGGGPPH